MSCEGEGSCRLFWSSRILRRFKKEVTVPVLFVAFPSISIRFPRPSLPCSCFPIFPPPLQHASHPSLPHYSPPPFKKIFLPNSLDLNFSLDIAVSYYFFPLALFSFFFSSSISSFPFIHLLESSYLFCPPFPWVSSTVFYFLFSLIFSGGALVVQVTLLPPYQ